LSLVICGILASIHQKGFAIPFERHNLEAQQRQSLDLIEEGERKKSKT
jgi:hypothetical protein